MQILNIGYDYYKLPEEFTDIEQFMSYVNVHYNSFIPLTQYQTENCVFPYLIEEDTKTVYVNPANARLICAEDAIVIQTRKEYDDRLRQVVRTKCVGCIHYREDEDGDDLAGHRDKLTLDGKCWEYEAETL